MELIQQLTQQLSAQQIQNLHLLQLNTVELMDYLAQAALENPLIDLDRIDIEKSLAVGSKNEGKQEYGLRDWFKINDFQNHEYYFTRDDEYDPYRNIGNDGGLEDTLTKHLNRQIEPLDLSKKEKSILCRLVELLDEDGYLRVPEDEILSQLHIQKCEYLKLLKQLRAFTPAGVGASSVNECIALQLDRMGESKLFCDIAMNHLDDLARYKDNKLVHLYHITPENLAELRSKIKQTNPKPGSVFEKKELIQYVEPDIIVNENSGVIDAHLVRGSVQFFTMNQEYLELMKTAEDSSVRKYLAEKLQQFNSLKFGIAQREKTIIKCTKLILSKQYPFFQGGGLAPLTMSEVADELNMNVSTVSRAVKNKYLLCSKGLFPLEYFFAHSAEKERGEISNITVKTLIKTIIDGEDSRCPLSDQKICEKLAQEGCRISRRTVAKYRVEMNIPGTSGRKRL